VIDLAVKEVASHAVLVQGELDKQKHERELAVNRVNAGRRAPGKLRRLRGPSPPPMVSCCWALTMPSRGSS
jgi:hypothetical protein